jgi:regulator of replication initiation timing
MTSLLDDVKRMLEIEYGDIPRLKHIKKTLEENKMLYISDRKYLYKLTQDNLEKTTTKTSQFDSEKIKYTTDENLEIEELEGKIRVDEEPS